jgi:hypothetical protein
MISSFYPTRKTNHIFSLLLPSKMAGLKSSRANPVILVSDTATLRSGGGKRPLTKLGGRGLCVDLELSYSIDQWLLAASFPDLKSPMPVSCVTLAAIGSKHKLVEKVWGWRDGRWAQGCVLGSQCAAARRHGVSSPFPLHHRLCSREIYNPFYNIMLPLIGNKC